MFGPTGAIIIILALLTAVVLFLLVAFGAFPGVMRTVRRSFWCPFLRRNVTTEFQEKAWDGKRVDVNSCTAFTPANAVTCGKFCVELEKLPAAKENAATRTL